MVSYVAGIDSSTQSCKVAIVDASTGELIRSGRAPHPAGTEVDPEAWWDALMLAIADAGGLDDVLAVSVAGQQHGLVALDASGVVVRDALLWNDVRSESAAQALTDELGAEYLASTTGLLPVSSFTVSKLRWLRDAEPENAGRVAAVALPHDWLTWRLRGYGPTGRLGPNLAALTTDRSDASGTGYWSPLSGSYVTEILENALGGAPILPDVLEPAAIAGYTQAYGQVPSGLLVAAGSGDNAAAALGLGAQAGDVFISIGTSGTVFAVSNTPTCDVTGTVAGFADASGLFLPLVATLNAAQVVDTVASLLGVSHDEFSRLALSSVPGADGVLLTPYFAGERTPNLPQATASFASLTYRNTTRANLARAAVEGMLQGLAVGLDALAQHSVRAERLTLIGGGAKLRATQQIATEVFHRNVIVPPPAEYVALGAALQASWAMLGERPTWSATSTVVRSR